MPVREPKEFNPLAEAMLQLVYPNRCVICEAPGSLLCDKDRSLLSFIDHDTACPRCSAPFGRDLCTECVTRTGEEQFAFEAAFSSLLYDARTEAMIVAYKDLNERRLAPLLAEILVDSMPPDWRLWAGGITYVPADGAALRRRGFDHMQLLASRVADRLQLPIFDLLVKYSSSDQRRLSRWQRRDNAALMFGFTLAPLPASCNLLLLDDVLTTGATLNAAAQVLLDNNVSHVCAVTLARVW